MSNAVKACCGPGYASPKDAIKAPREKLLYTIAIYVGTGIQKPDYLATVDADPESPTYSQVISRCEMPGIGDELHHMGWNACSSCFDDGEMERKYLIVPGVRSSNLHIVDCATDPRNPRVHKVISGDEIKEKTNLSAPHTVHCLGSDIIISMLGDAKGNAPGGYLHLDKDFNIVGRWENSMGDIKFGYDFWYQPRHNVMVSSEWAAPNTFMPGFDLEEVGHLKYGREIHLWDFEKKEPRETFYLGEDGLVPLEVRFHHDPASSHGFVGAAMSSNIIHWWKDEDEKWQWEKIIDVANEPHPELPTSHIQNGPFPCPASSPLFFCLWMINIYTSAIGCMVTFANTIFPTRITLCLPAKFGWVACSTKRQPSTVSILRVDRK